MDNVIRLLECFYQTPWAILESHLKHLEIQLLQAYKTGSEEALTAAIAARNAKTAKTINASAGIGVIPIQGPIGHRASFISDYFGWPTTERLGQAIQQMAADPNVGAILLDINSPGGVAVGNEELHQQIMQTREQKPIVAIANGQAASAAYYIASAASEIVITPSSEVGSIGCVMMHADVSKMYQDAGIDITVITAGKYKWEGHPYAPLTEEAKAEFQREVDACYQMFVNAVAKGRGVPVSTVKNDFGQGRMIMGKDAVKVGMADRLGTMDETVARLGGKQSMGGVMLHTGVNDLVRAEISRLMPEIVQQSNKNIREAIAKGGAMAQASGYLTANEVRELESEEPKQDSASEIDILKAKNRLLEL